MRTLLVAVALVAAACTGRIEAPGPEGTGGGTGGAACEKVGTPGTKLIRLTHAQYDNSVRDLLGLAATANPSSVFQKDPSFGGFTNNALGLDVRDRLGRDYRRAAEDLGQQVIASPAAMAKVVPCTEKTDACAQTFVATFGRKAFRRPLTIAERTTFSALFKKGDQVMEGTDPFLKGVALVVEAMLQMPEFLYRVELAEAVPFGGKVPLNSFELAARLSYLLWNTTPDAALLDLAEAGKLTTAAEVKAQAVKMLDDPRAQAVSDDFHHQWLDLDRYNNLTRDATLFPAFSPAVSPMMQQETLRFVRHAIFEEKAPFATLFTAKYTFVNKELAALYALGGTYTTGTYAKADLPAAQRSGLLTQTGFLASHAYARSDSPIHRGVFIIRKILCQPLSDPPGNADLNLPPLSGNIKTTRQQVANHTSPMGCSGCHNRINEMGYAFENYDAVGQYRTMENGEPVDSKGTVSIDGKSVSFTNALELSEAIAASNDARSCYAKHWLRYAYQRQETKDDACDLAAISTNLGTSGYAMREMIADLTQTDSFRNRPAEEVP